MEFSNAVAVMDSIGGWEKRTEDENLSGARFRVCMWICSKAVLSPRPEDLENFKPTSINKTWEFLHGAHEWLQQCFMEL